MITIFSTCRPCNEEFDRVQRTAITSWARLPLQPEIILFGDERGAAEIARDVGCRHIPDIAREYGKPLINVMFAEARRLATHDILAFINADIVLMDDFAHAVKQVARAVSGRFLMVGRRWDVGMPHIDFDNMNWQAELRAYIDGPRGKLNVSGGTDYFVWRGRAWPEIPPATVARRWYDTWLVWDAVTRGEVVVDATPVVLALHPKHTRDSAVGVSLQRNAALCAKKERGDPGIAPWVLTKEGLQRRQQ